MAEMTKSPPCRHYADTPPSGCLLPGRKAPHDCMCAAYSEDLSAALGLDAEAGARRAAWQRAMSGEA